MKMTTNEPKLWEIWQFEFAFEEDPQKTKKRPVIIAAKNSSQEELIVLSVKVTSHPPRKGFQGEVALLDWEKAGLIKPSTARCSKYLLVPIKAFEGCFCYGRLSKRDESAVRQALLSMNIIK